ncbi:MAG: cytochrome c3 family protein [Geobacteraceae bacterium]|nr:cytochrome c3 family protein [Geobacteraceae bacterium]
MRYLIITAAFVFVIMTGLSEGAGRKISQNGNKHNFAYTNISVNFRAVQGGDTSGNDRSSQICVFCHTPHRASSEGPLWNRKAVTKTFKHFSSGSLAIDDAGEPLKSAADYGQPTGSSRLCLSCHDGVTALGAVFTTPTNANPAGITFTNVRTGQTGTGVAIGFETFSSHHPVSFRYSQAVIDLLKAPPYNKTDYWWSPTSSAVKLDKQGRMQCTTCHDPHQDQSDNPSTLTPFWTSKTYGEVCGSCHNVIPTPNPW